ncbi:MAG: c-type cytochrome domain-containing protein [Pirellulales bacterium]
MTCLRLTVCAVLFGCSLAASCVGFAQETKPAGDGAKDLVTYRDHVLPVLQRRCANCHNPDKATSDLNVLSYQTLIAGGASGEAVSPGKPDQSLLYRLVAHLDEPSMPPRQPKIPDVEITTIKRWIELGAPETTTSAVKVASRKMELDASLASIGKPEGPPPMPQSLPSVELPPTLRPHPVTAMAASPWAPVIAVAGHERILLYHSETLEPLGVLPFPERVPHVLRFSRNGKVLLAAGGHGADSGKAVLFDVASGKRIAAVGDESDVVLAADVSPDLKWIALGGPEKLVKIYAVESGELRQKIKKHTDWVTAIEFSPNGEFLASGDRNGGAFIWEAATGGIVFTLGDHRDAVTQLDWRADSQMLATASEDGRVILWYAEDGFPTRTINAHAESNNRGNNPRNKLPGVLAVAYSSTGMFATVGRDNTARIWRPDGNQSQKLQGLPDLPTRVVFNHEATRVFVGDYTGAVRCFSVKDGQPLGDLQPGAK